MNYSQVQEPYIRNTRDFKRADRRPHPFLDKIEVNQNLLIQIEEPGFDVTVIPIKHNFDFFAKFRNGPRFLYGQTQELKAEFGSFTIEMQECQHIPNTTHVYRGDAKDLNDEQKQRAIRT